MHPDLEKLMVLQTHDIEAKRLRDKIDAFPKQIADLEKKLKAVEGQRTVIRDLLAKEEVLRRRHESDVEDHQSKIKRVRKQMDLATTTIQVTAFEHEIAFAQGEIGKLEDAALESMERSDGFEEQQRQANDAVDNAGATLERERAHGTEALSADKESLAAVEGLRSSLRPEIGEEMLATYDRVGKTKGTAVSEALNQQCSSCQMMIRPQKWNDLRERDDKETVFTCDSCGRLLFYDPARDAPQRKTVPVESIAASIIRSL